VLQRKLSFLIIILIIWGIEINNVTAATTAGWGDIVNVEYSLYLDAQEGIVGAQVNQPTEFVILAKDAYSNDINHPLYNKDLYYIITLLEIIYDASAETTTTTTTTTQASSPDPLQDFGGIIIIGGGVVLIGGIYTLWSYISSRRMKSVFTEEKLSSNVREQTLKKERSQLKELRELTESFSGSEDTAEKSDVKFRRRR
jgi:hypothetical protein